MAVQQRLTMVIPFLIVLVTVFVNLAKCQLNLPDMPGPPYPDRYGNNRWGVKYDPRLHGARRPSQQSSSIGPYGGEETSHHPPQHPPRYHGRRPQSAPSRSKWAPGLKPLVSSYSRYKKHHSHKRRRPHYRGRDKSVDRYVKNYMSHYNHVAQTPSATSDLVNIQNFLKPMDLSDKFHPSYYSDSDDDVSASIKKNTRVRTSRLSQRQPTTLFNGNYTRRQTPNYRTYNPQSDFFITQGPSETYKKGPIKRNFAKTLSNIYNDYKPGGENSNGGISLSSGSGAGIDSSGAEAANRDSANNVIIIDDEYISDPYSASPPGPPPSYSSSGPRPPPGGFRLREVSTIDGPPRGPPPSYYGKRPRPPPGSRKPLSALDLYEDSKTYSVGSSPFDYSSGGGGDIDYSGHIVTSSGGPMSYSGLDSGGPPSSSVMSLDSYGLSPGPFSPISSPMSSYPPSSPAGFGSYVPLSNYVHSPGHTGAYPPNLKSKRKKPPRFQHTPMNVLRGLFGREREPHRGAYANNIPQHLPPPHHHQPGGPPLHHQPAGPAPHHRPAGPPPQYSHNPLYNTLSGGLDFMDQPRQPYHHPRPPRPQYNPLTQALADFLEKQRQRPETPSAVRPRLPASGEAEGETTGDDKEVKQYKTEYHNWPRIFTAVGSTVDAVAGGIHAARKEVSKMAGEAVAKSIMMGGTAVHEVSKGMATVITKMAHI